MRDGELFAASKVLGVIVWRGLDRPNDYAAHISGYGSSVGFGIDYWDEGLNDGVEVRLGEAEGMLQIGVLVPEPSTFTFVLVGMGIFGVVMRNQRREHRNSRSCRA